MPDQKDKNKRKHKQTEDDRPKKKKKAVRYDDKPIGISVIESSGLWAPVFASAPGLELPKDTSFQAYQKYSQDGPKGSKHSETDLLLHSGSHPRLDYVATEPPKDSFERGTKHYLGVYDPETSLLQLVLAKQLTVRSGLKHGFVVDQKLAHKEATMAAANAPDSVAMKYAAARVALGEEFGTKKAKKAIKSAAANAVSTPIVNGVATITDHSQAILEGASITNGADNEGDADERKATLANLVNDAHPRPKPNVDAEKPIDVYRLGYVIGRQELDLVDIEDWKSAAENGTSIQTPSRFVSFRFAKLASSKNDRDLKALKFLLHLLRWMSALETRGPSKKLPKKEKMDEVMAGVNKELVRKIKQKFAPDTSLSPWHVQKLQLHACAIALSLDNCTSDVRDLQEDLKITTQEIKQLYKELGCKVEAPTEKEMQKKGISKAEAAQHHLAKLRMPFTLPQARQRRMKKK